jgi:hypothetical protein
MGTHRPRNPGARLGQKVDEPRGGLSGYGLSKGCNADFVLLDAKSPIEAIRLRATRLAVVRRGVVVA